MLSSNKDHGLARQAGLDPEQTMSIESATRQNCPFEDKGCFERKDLISQVILKQDSHCPRTEAIRRFAGETDPRRRKVRIVRSSFHLTLETQDVRLRCRYCSVRSGYVKRQPFGQSMTLATDCRQHKEGKRIGEVCASVRSSALSESLFMRCP
jgi:hypothetical protein